MSSPNNNHRLLIISNRLPVVLKRENGEIIIQQGSGGLVTAIAPVLRDRGGLWIGWSGSHDLSSDEINHCLEKQRAAIGYSLVGISLTQQEIEEYYLGFSNQIIWPLFHDLPSLCTFKPAYWHTTETVMQKFAQTIAKNAKKGDLLWVHDYQLLTLGRTLREQGVSQQIAFFLHIPFPPLDIFIKLPWRFQILRAILKYDLLGFQTLRDLRNFTQCVKRLLPECQLASGKTRLQLLNLSGREIKSGAFPISINYDEFAKAAKSAEVEQAAWLFHEKFKDQQIVFSLDRLDFTKGIPYRLEAIGALLKKYPELHKKVTFIEVVIPSRTEIPEYQNLKQEIDRLVSAINSQFTQEEWVPIHYIFRSLSKEELVMHYRTSEVCLVTSVKDGMNLVCKEYIASNIETSGVLILSEFAGAAAQFYKEALLINPYDIEGVCDALYQALTMPEEERKTRMRRMKQLLRKQDIFHWVQHFLSVAFSKDLHDFPLVSEYIPEEKDS